MKLRAVEVELTKGQFYGSRNKGKIFPEINQVYLLMKAISTCMDRQKPRKDER